MVMLWLIYIGASIVKNEGLSMGDFNRTGIQWRDRVTHFLTMGGWVLIPILFALCAFKKKSPPDDDESDDELHDHEEGTPSHKSAGGGSPAGMSAGTGEQSTFTARESGPRAKE